ncbi:response regulator [Clostridium chromiireducens]|uniref:Stage 0 sporulation protein A homolog n=1 Tax=Clostridium chromiireducens TaxID=225345 RepID=A0A1V4II57_9CLOT|nr:response regulator [Clostridium chromiireducens]OPJ59692.1 transcriptional regulatory protein YehT [Clostridium chromiireducens]
MLSAVIVDDEIHVLNLLKMFLQKTEQVNVLETFHDSSIALKNIIDIKPDVVFLDIEMPEINGLELANCLLEQNDELMIVFVTGYNQYALEAFEVNALDYILKPVNSNRIQKCVSRLNKLKTPMNQEKTHMGKTKICCFGNFEVHGNNGVIKWPTRKVEEMFAYFIFHKDSNVECGELGEILWPEGEPDKIKANFDTSLFRLRKTIKENGLPIEISSKKRGKGVYRCYLHGLSSDVIEFKNAALKNVIVNKSNINRFEQICSLYRDDLFSKKDYGWCEGEREYLSRDYTKMLKNIAYFYLGEGLYENAMDKLLTAKRKSPFDEEVHLNILKIFAIQKNRALLVKSHEEFKLELFQEMGIEPHGETNEFFMKLLNEL